MNKQKLVQGFKLDVSEEMKFSEGCVRNSDTNCQDENGQDENELQLPGHLKTSQKLMKQKQIV